MMSKNNRQIKLEHFHNLIVVAYADGELEEIEQEFLSDKAEEYGISKEDIQYAFANVDNLQFQIPMNSIDREDQLSDVVFMTMVDGEVHDKEYEICLKIAEKLDLNKEYLDHIIELTKKLST